MSSNAIWNALEMPNCIGCNDPLTKGNKSEAHIIPNALGGRLAPTDLICRVCNNVLDRAVDNALVKAFGGLLTMIDVPRQRGKNPSINIQTVSGKRVRMEPDGRSTVSDVVYEVKDEPDKRTISLSAPTPKLARQLLERMRKENPTANIDVDKIASLLRASSLPADEQLLVRLDYTPKAIFGGVMAAIWLFIAHREGHSLDNLEMALKRLQGIHEHGGMFRYLPDGLPGLVGPSIAYPNKLVVRSVPSTGKLIGYVELLGTFRIGGIYRASSDLPAELIEHIYVHDPFAVTDRSAEFSISAGDFESVNWRAVGLGPVKQDSDELHKVMKDAGERLTSKYYERRI